MPNRVEYRAFTASYNVSVKRLISPASILPILTVNKTASSIPNQIRAFWDTGATISCIKPELFNRLQLRLYNTAGLTTIAGVGGKIEAALTLVNLFLTSTFVITFCPLYITDFPGKADVLIGMDIIQMGDFAVCNADSKTSFSFAMPPFSDRIDLAHKAENANKNNSI